MSQNSALRIGVSACFFHADPLRPIFKGMTLQYCEQSLLHWVMGRGDGVGSVMAYMIPHVAENSRFQMRDYVADLDGLVLQGGSDVAPQSYGEQPLKPEWRGDFVRDAYERQLIAEFLAQGKPVLGVCRGMQIINVAFGGTMYQDIAMQLPQARGHRDWDIYEKNFHRIHFVPDSGLSRMYPGVTTAKVNSIHHQAVKDLGRHLVVEARSEGDGIVEALRLKDPANPHAWVMGVQWHPEFSDPEDASLLNTSALLHDFLNAARSRRAEARSQKGYVHA